MFALIGGGGSENVNTGSPLLIQISLKYGFCKKLDSPAINTLERHSLNVKKCLFNVLITTESNFDERNGQLLTKSTF